MTVTFPGGEGKGDFIISNPEPWWGEGDTFWGKKEEISNLAKSTHATLVNFFFLQSLLAKTVNF